MKQGREDVEDGKGKCDEHGKHRKKSGGTRYEKSKEEKGRKGDGRRRCHSLIDSETPGVISFILPRVRAARCAVNMRHRASGSRLQLVSRAVTGRASTHFSIRFPVTQTRADGSSYSWLWGLSFHALAQGSIGGFAFILSLALPKVTIIN